MGMKQWIRKVRRRRPRSLSDAGGSGEGLEAESTIDLKAKGEQQVLRLPHVQVLFSSTRTSTDDGEISKAQISLQSSVEELESVLQAQLGQSTDELQNSIAACIAQGNDPRHGEPFKNILVSVQGDRAARVQAASSRAGAVMQKMYPLTKLALGLAGTITSSIGYAPVQIVTNGLTQVFELAMSVPRQSEEVMAGLDSMAADDYLLAELQKMPGDVLDDRLVLGAVVLETRLFDFLRKSILWLNKTFFAKFANCVVEPTQITDARTELKRAQDALRSHLSVENYLITKWQMIATAEAQMLNSLCSNEYHIAHLDKQNRLHSTRLEDSGMWAVTDERFKKWHGDTGGILWCPGLPGAGKTYLASRIVDELQIAGRYGDVGVAYVYCEYNRSQQQSDKVIIEAMTRQLIVQKPNLCFKFRQFLESSLATRLDDRRKLLTQVSTQFKTTFLVLDALDEFSADYFERHRLACILRDILLQCSTGQVRLCITSREADGIWQALNAGPVPAQFLDVHSSESDIRALVAKAYDEASCDRAIGWTYDNDELRQLVIDKVVERSDCIFKLAELQIRAILRKPSVKAVKSGLDHLTNNVNHYYNEAMQRISSQPETKDVVHKFLTWLTFTRSPIHVHELELALSIDPGQLLDHNLDDAKVDVLRYVGLSEGLIRINNKRTLSSYDKSLDDEEGSESEIHMDEPEISKGAQVTLAHESIRQFLRDIPQPGIPVEGDKFLLNCCLTIMSCPAFVGNLTAIWQQLLCREELPEDAEKGFSVTFGEPAVKIEVPVFLFWVLSSWGHHVSDDHLAPEIENAVRTINESAALAPSPPQGGTWAAPLFWCAYKGWAKACKVLLRFEENPNMFWQMELDRGLSQRTTETCLFAAVTTGDMETIKVFLADHRINPNIGKELYWVGSCTWTLVTPLIYACNQDRQDIVQELLANKAIDVNVCHVRSCGGGLPAMLRVKPDIISLLLQRDDVDVNIIRMGRRPIHHLANVGGSPDVLEMLLQNAKTDVNGRTWEKVPEGILVEERDKICFCHKRTALMVAAFMGHPAQTSVLLKHPKIDLHLRDSEGMTALMLASVGYKRTRTGWTFPQIINASADLRNSIQQHDETVQILLTTLKSVINERDEKGRTALMFASMGGVDPRWKGSGSFLGALGGPDPMHWYKILKEQALFQTTDHHVGILKTVLSNDNVNVNMPDDRGHTALDYAMWTRAFIIQQRDGRLRRIKKEVESFQRGPVPAGFYWAPDTNVQYIIDDAQSRIDVMSEIHDLLVAHGARSGEAIGPLDNPQDHTRESYSRKVYSASEQQERIDDILSKIESVV